LWPSISPLTRALGVYGAVASAGFAAGGLVVEVSWRLVFFVNMPVGVALLIASWRLLPADPPRGSAPLDVPGTVTAATGVALLVLGVTRPGNPQTDPPRRHRRARRLTAVAMAVAADLCLGGLLTTGVVPAWPPHRLSVRPEHLFQ
jgi:hypothetical protein